MIGQRKPGRAWRLLAVLCLALGASGCAMVKLKSVSAAEYIQAKRGDPLTTGHLSAPAIETLAMLGLSESACSARTRHCAEQLLDNDGVAQERTLATVAELWLQASLHLAKRQPRSDAELSAWLETARYAYAYLFFSARAPSERAFEDRQTQVRDYYNYAVQQAVSALFVRYRQQGQLADNAAELSALPGWRIMLDVGHLGALQEMPMPDTMLPASGLRFTGLRSVYRRDGFGAEMVAVLPNAASLRDAASAPDETSPAYSEMPTPSLTVLLRFDGDSLAKVLASRAVRVEAYDPYLSADATLGGHAVPLAGNFSAGHGVWMARSGFAAQSLRTLFGMARGIDRPHIFLTQPYDPNRRVLVLLHGLASSPEAWVNLANELLGDEQLRARYQIWLVYYPTNLPIAYNHIEIRKGLQQALDHFDPHRRSASAHGMVLVGHSMGGVLARLMVSSSGGDHLWQRLFGDSALDPQAQQALRNRLSPMLHFEPMAEVSEAIFLASPHRGTPQASGMLGSLVGGLIGMPARILDQFKDIAGTGLVGKLPTSMDNLSDHDDFVQAAADLKISPKVTFHSIIARRDPRVPLARSDDGFVPYWSAHLDGAASETVITSGHSVQETPQAILEIRKLLR
ncbi:alpha/beta fold hydrolase [Xanthomonas sp. NCPPB 2654]|uniref:esterase/lipase family protein n=1 Tax=unclassified Xanthomonas TaxID=2643310 RepID=UPI0021E0A396|nr:MULTISPECIES: alpha/beta fold hydrolase [unclassified Xanthomonas]MDL5364790.1 alpha/beta fold hydrolase [Xanthomonas sp. NCPPB 2654]UYC18818.1 alpha/beta fold hydrolase [Xanthomonas sp. CFBP 8443]